MRLGGPALRCVHTLTKRSRISCSSVSSRAPTSTATTSELLTQFSPSVYTPHPTQYTTRTHTGLVAASSILAHLRSLWPLAFLLCSMAAALAAARTLEGGSRVCISSFSSPRGGRRQHRQSVSASRARAEIEDLLYPKELKEWVYPAQ